MKGKMNAIPPSKLPTFMRIAEVADLLRMSKHTIYELVAREAIPYRKPAGVLLFDLDEIVEWTKKSKRRSPPSSLRLG